MLDLGCKSVLLVEDEPEILGILGDMFEDEGLETTRAASAEQAIALLRAGVKPDLVLVDLGLPRMGGDEFVALLRESPEWREIPAAVMTGDRTGFEELRRFGADDVLHKPFSLERLNEVMSRLCARSRTGT
jgi:CheY-like chemotaxis protein